MQVDTTLTSQALHQADFVVVGSVLGPVDSASAEESRKHLIAHWIRVDTTLVGVDQSGQRLGVQPNGNRLEDGKSYIFFLQWIDFQWASVLPPLIEASAAHVDAMAADIAALGKAASPPRRVWMRYSGSWGGGILTEFYVTADGRFEWKNRVESQEQAENHYELLEGNVPSEVIAALIEQLEAPPAKPLLATADAGDVAVRWRDETGKGKFRRFQDPNEVAAIQLLESIEKLARTYGEKPQPGR